MPMIFVSRYRRLRRFAVALCCAASLALPAFAQSPAVPKPMRLFSVGTGEVAGTYYAVASAICAAMNRAVDPGLRCSPEATRGSIDNLVSLRRGELDFAVIQSDWQRYAYDGDFFFESAGPMTELRAVMALYPETLTLLAVKGRGIDGLAALKGRRVDIGAPASGRRATALTVLQSAGIQMDDIPVVMELPIAGAYDELCAGRIDASLMILGHPNATLQRVLSTCAVEIVAISAQESARIMSENTDFQPAEIAARTYEQQQGAVPTLSILATLVTRADLDDATVAQLVTSTLTALPKLRISTPTLSRLQPAQMATLGNIAPAHPGAVAAFAAFLQAPPPPAAIAPVNPGPR